MAGYTAGPWHVEDDDCVYATVNGDDILLAVKGGEDYGGWLDREDDGKAEFAFNMKVMALAPELIEALRSILLYVDPSGDGLYDGAKDLAGIKQNGELVLKGSFITTCIRARSALTKASPDA